MIISEKDRYNDLLDLGYISVTEFLLILKELKLSYTRQGMNAVKRSGTNDIFEYDATAFGCKLYSREKFYKLIEYVCNSKNTSRERKEIDKAFKTVLSEVRIQIK